MRTTHQCCRYWIACFWAISITLITAQPQLPFTWFPENPVIRKGNPGDWDAAAAFIPRTIFHNDTFYLFYNGRPDFASNGVAAIGLATSTDGFHYTKSANNPVFGPDGSGFDSLRVTGATPIIEDDSLWIVFHAGRRETGFGPGKAIGRITATSPYGPWTRRNEPVMEVGAPGDWDAGFVAPNSVVATDSGYLLYYTGASTSNAPFLDLGIGMAISTDGGYSWKKYDDPATTAPPFANSDYILQPGPPGSWEYPSVSDVFVGKTDLGYEMFYTGNEALGYATSSDGIHWVKDSLNNPIWTLNNDPMASIFIEAPSVVIHDSTYFMYYSDGTREFINLTTAPSTQPVGGLSDEPVIAAVFELRQNYPNPFNPGTTIEFNLPQAGLVKLKLYNVLGQIITTLVSKNLPAGMHRYYWNATGMASGVYFYQIELGRHRLMKKALLIK